MAVSPPASLAPAPSPLDLPSYTPFDPELEALLPAELGGAATTRDSYSLTTDPGAGDVCFFYPCPGEMGRLAAEAGVELADISIAVAFKTVVPGVELVAIRVNGVPGPDLLAARIRAESFDLVFPVEIAGKHVTWAAQGPLLLAYRVDYLYATNSVLFIIKYGPQSMIPDPLPPPTQTEVAEAVAALP